MRIYYTGVDQGDGSVGVSFFEAQECIELWEEADPEGYRGEGGSSFEVPDGTPVLGLNIQTLEQTKIEVDEWNSYK